MRNLKIQPIRIRPLFEVRPEAGNLGSDRLNGRLSNSAGLNNPEAGAWTEIFSSLLFAPASKINKTSGRAGGFGI
jgi:hypothetical protein